MDKSSVKSLSNHTNIIFKIKVKSATKSPNFGIFLILISMCILLAIANKQFLAIDNLFSVARAISYIAIIAIGQCMVIVTGGIDLSVGSVFGFSGLITAVAISRWGLPIPLAIFIGLISGTFFGAFSGFTINKLKLPSFIATLGTMSIVRGFDYILTTGYPIQTPPEFNWIGQIYVGPVPITVVYLLILAIIFSIFLNKTVMGRWIYATGGNETVAIMSGIPAERVKLLVYSITGFLAGFSGIVTTARLGVAQPTAGLGYEMDVIAAVIIGGASMTGGRGTILGTIIGGSIMGVLKNGLVLLNVSSYWQQTVMGFVIIIAVTIDQLRQKKIS